MHKISLMSGTQLKRSLLVIALLVTALLTLSSCMSIPLSTLREMRNFDQQDFLGLDGSQVQLRLAIPAPVRLNPDLSFLTFAMETGEKTVEHQLSLELVDEHTARRSTGWLSRAAAVNVQHFRLDPAGLQAFAATQASVAHLYESDLPLEQVESYFSIQFGLSERPEGDFFRVWVELQLSEERGFFTLFDGAKIHLAYTDSVPEHVDSGTTDPAAAPSS